ncbi:MAG: hypothetical protein WAU86_18155, partial [Oricola sp.]
MFVFILQTVLLILIAFVLGAVIGCLLRTQQGGLERKEPPPKAEPRAIAPGAASASTTTAVVSAPEPAKAKEADKPQGKAGSPRKTRSKSATSRAAASANAVAALAARDDLKRIAGIGRQNEARLNALGIARFEQIARWTKKDVEAWGVRL